MRTCKNNHCLLSCHKSTTHNKIYHSNQSLNLHLSSHNPGPSSHPAESSTSNTTVASSLNARSARIKRNREEASNNQMIQAERMVKRSRVELKAGEPGDNVAVLIPLVDRGRGDPRNILGVIINRDLETNLYRIAVRAGILATYICYSKFTKLGNL